MMFLGFRVLRVQSEFGVWAVVVFEVLGWAGLGVINQAWATRNLFGDS